MLCHATSPRNSSTVLQSVSGSDGPGGAAVAAAALRGIPVRTPGGTSEHDGASADDVQHLAWLCAGGLWHSWSQLCDEWQSHFISFLPFLSWDMVEESLSSLILCLNKLVRGEKKKKTRSLSPSIYPYLTVCSLLCSTIWYVEINYIYLNTPTHMIYSSFASQLSSAAPSAPLVPSSSIPASYWTYHGLDQLASLRQVCVSDRKREAQT